MNEIWVVWFVSRWDEHPFTFHRSQRGAERRAAKENLSAYSIGAVDCKFVVGHPCPVNP